MHVKDQVGFNGDDVKVGVFHGAHIMDEIFVFGVQRGGVCLV